MEGIMHPLVAEIFGVDGVIVLIVVVAVLFGGSQIPKLARSLGSAQSEFKKGLDAGKNDTTDVGSKIASTDSGEPNSTKS
jgi:sec-independent protein translocase protein TatA